MLERFSRCCCGRCDACSGQNPAEMLLVVPSTWTQAPYGACDAAKCNGFAGTFVLDIYGADACFYKGPVDTDTDRCMWYRLPSPVVVRGTLVVLGRQLSPPRGAVRQRRIRPRLVRPLGSELRCHEAVVFGGWPGSPAVLVFHVLLRAARTSR